MAYNIVYKNSVQRDLKKLLREETVRVLKQIDEELLKNDETCPALKGRFAGLRKYHVCDCRVVYTIFENDILVLRISHRKDVYKKEI